MPLGQLFALWGLADMRQNPKDSTPLSDLIRREGGIIALTGELTCCDRMTAMEIFDALGLRVSGSVSSRSTFLLCGTDPQQRKIDQAIERSVPVFTEDEFWSAVDELLPSE